MRARTIGSLDLDSYQRAARTVLANHLVTTRYPDRNALPLIRAWAPELREDLAETFGYRLEVTETTARLHTVRDALHPAAPAVTSTDRPFDRRRYALLALAIAVLGRSGGQVTLSELAERVAADAAGVDGVDLDTDLAADRDAFADAVGWLAHRGALALADGDAGGWTADPEAGEALYDIDRGVVAALFRPRKAVQHLRSVAELTGEPEHLDDHHDGSGSDTGAAGRRVRRALVERPVVYADELTDTELVHLASPRSVEDVRLLTGLVPERRREGIAMIDPSGRLSSIRFPGNGTVAQVALLLAGEICDRVLAEQPSADTGTGTGPDTEGTATPERRAWHDDRSAVLTAQLDGAMPRNGVFDALATDTDTTDTGRHPGADHHERASAHPFLGDDWLTATVDALSVRYGRTFAAQWQADPRGLARRAVDVLDRLRLVHPVPGGLLALPALARYRGVVVGIRSRTADPALFEPPPPEPIPPITDTTTDQTNDEAS